MHGNPNGADIGAALRTGEPRPATGGLVSAICDPLTFLERER